MASEKRPALLSFAEGRILLVGTLLLGLYLFLLFLSWLVFPDHYKAFAAMSVSNFFFGRAAGISVGFAAGLDALVVISVNFFVELLMVLIVYPLFALSWKRLLNIGRLKHWIDKSHQSAIKYRPFIEKYGVYGLFAFVWFPFWMTGPVVGSIIGYLMEFTHRTTLSVVLVGTLIATICWAYALLFLQEWAASFDARAPWLIVALLVILGSVAYLVRRITK